ncbi:MAG: polyribonucleotide nucleotidyltransferase [Anaerolineaceae bacterium]|nr:polyribonucleotide nucleotidyltransferase [Anaerolineaceae bacterium]
MENQVKEYEVVKEIGGRNLILRSGKLAKQASGAVWVQYGDSVVMVAATAAKPRREIDWFPLFMDYREKQYSAGKVPRGFFKREGRPTDKEILTMRLMDRPLRPLFPDGYNDEVQIQAIVLSFDPENETDVMAMIGASASVCVSPIPFNGPVGSVRVGRLDGELIINPTIEQTKQCDLEILMSGTDTEINMLEVSAGEASDEDLMQAFELGHKAIREIVAMQAELAKMVGVEKTWTPPESDPELPAVVAKYEDLLIACLELSGKQAQAEALDELKAKVLDEISPEEVEEPRFERSAVASEFGNLKKKAIRQRILAGIRPDGRKPDQLRPISCEVGILPRTHGSALFTRGETQALVAATLGTGQDQQVIDGLAPEYKKSFMLQYNFPPFSVGEVKPIRGPSRRDIGHGNLAERCLQAVMPKPDDFAYTVLAVSEILESNGSSSMATVCGATLAMMDAGVPVSDPVAGISIGLVKEGDQQILLTDIQGAEDHYGDMDFKVAGTQNGVTGIQLDVKVAGLSMETVGQAIKQARVARTELLKIMISTLNAPRPEISEYAPRLLLIHIDPEKIGKVIGPGGKIIKAIQEETGARIEIEDDGSVMISCVDAKGAEQARERVEQITEDVKIGKVYTGKVMSIKDFGAFIEVTPGQDGLCHVSELAETYVKNIEDVIKLGDVVRVKVIQIDAQGRIKLSRKAALKEEKDAVAASE